MKKKILLIIIIFFFSILVFARNSYAVELNWIFPLDSYKQIRDPVGPRPVKPVAGVADFHHGRDISANQGTPVKAVQSGVVEYIGDGNDINNGGCGLQVWVSHNGVYKTMYNHLSVISVQKGQTVTQGQVVGQVGSTGLSTGPHLDFRVYLEGANCKYDKVNGEYLVIKNNITKRAFEECKIEGLEEFLNGPTAVIIGNEDYLEPAKAIYEYTKSNDFYKIKVGVIEGKVTSSEEIITLAKLPSREVLLAKLAGSLLGNVTKLAIALNEVVKTKNEN